VARTVASLNVDTVIFDDELSPGQLRNLEKAFSTGGREARVADRTALILDIFSQRARTREGMLQARLGAGWRWGGGRPGRRRSPGRRWLSGHALCWPPPAPAAHPAPLPPLNKRLTRAPAPPSAPAEMHGTG
jgi:hypothetical protein